MAVRTLLLPLREKSLHLVRNEVVVLLGLESHKQGLRDPAPAVIRAQLTIFHDQQSALGYFDQNFARRHENPEIGHGRLR